MVVVGVLAGGGVFVTTAAPAGADPVTFDTVCTSPGIPDLLPATWTVDGTAPATAPRGSEVSLTNFEVTLGDAPWIDSTIPAVSLRVSLAPNGAFTTNDRVEIPAGGGATWPTGTGTAIADGAVGSQIDWRVIEITMTVTFILPLLFTCDPGEPTDPIGSTTVTAVAGAASGGTPKVVPGENRVRVEEYDVDVPVAGRAAAVGGSARFTG